MADRLAPKISMLAHAIAQAEGFGVAGKIPTRAHNPGDLKLGDKGHGLMGEGITVFASDEEGWNELRRIVSGWLVGHSKIYHLTDSFREVGRKWVEGPKAPESAESLAWAHNVAREALGVPIETTLGEWVGMP